MVSLRSRLTLRNGAILCTGNKSNFSSQYFPPPQSAFILGDIRGGIGTLKNNTLMVFKQLTMYDLLGWFLQKQEESFVYLWNA